MCDFDVASQMIPVEALVSACDWVLSRHTNGLTIRGCPVTSGFGSPLAVAVKTAGTLAFVAGSALELELQNPERYKSGKGRLSVLIVGFYCSKKKYDSESAVFHVSYYLAFMCSSKTPTGCTSGGLGEATSYQAGSVSGACIHDCCVKAGRDVGKSNASQNQLRHASNAEKISICYAFDGTRCAFQPTEDPDQCSFPFSFGK